MTDREAVMYIVRKTRENSLLVPGKVMFGLWNRKTGAVIITDDLPMAQERLQRGSEMIRTYVDGHEVELLGRRYGEYGEMVYMNRELYGKIRSM